MVRRRRGEEEEEEEEGNQWYGGSRFFLSFCNSISPFSLSSHHQLHFYTCERVCFVKGLKAVCFPFCLV